MASRLYSLPLTLADDLPTFSAKVDHQVLAAGVAETWTVPAGVHAVRVQYVAGTLYANASGTTAAVPTVDVATGLGSFIIPFDSSWRVEPGAEISLINATACLVIFLYYNDGRNIT